jgi:hypothetical protein
MKSKAKKLTPEEEDMLGMLIVGMVQMGWSITKIEKLIGRHFDVVTRLYTNALDKIETGEADSSTLLKGCNRRFGLSYVGGSEELEGFERAEIDRQYGRRPTGHKSDE